MKKNNIKNSELLHRSYIDCECDSSIMPSYYIIEPTNHCNYSCPICPNRLYANDEKGYMSYEMIEKSYFVYTSHTRTLIRILPHLPHSLEHHQV